MPESTEQKVIPDELESKIDVDFDALLGELRDLEAKPKMDAVDVYSTVGRIEGRIEFEAVNKYALEDNEEKGFELVEKYRIDKVNGLYKSLMDRIKHDCGDVGSISVLGQALELVSSKASESLIERRKRKKTTSEAEYNPLTGEIALGSTTESQDAYATLCRLASDGFSYPVSTLHHEWIHSKQFERPEKEKMKYLKSLTEQLSWLSTIIAAGFIVGWKFTLPIFAGHVLRNAHLQRIKWDKRILDEAHAYAGEDRFTSSGATVIDLLEDLKRGKLGKVLEKPKNIDRLIIGGQEVKRLYALGLSDEEIAELVKHAKWDKKTKSYDTLEGKVQELMKEDDLDEEDVDNLVLADDIKRKIYVEKVRLITQDEIKRTYEKLTKGKAE